MTRLDLLTAQMNHYTDQKRWLAATDLAATAWYVLVFRLDSLSTVGQDIVMHYVNANDTTTQKGHSNA